MTRFLESLKALGPTRLLGISGVGLVVLAIIAFVALRGGSQPMALLYSDLDLHDSAQVVATLDKLHVAYVLKNGGLQILVPSDQVDRLRLTLASDGVPASGSVGYEVFDRGDSLTSNQFQQQMNQLRALEGELGRTIRTIRNVRNARVHLVLGKREPFAREQQEAQASIVLAMAGGQRMDDDEVQAVVNLVSAAVPGLKTQNISVVDSQGRLLARAGRSSGQNGGAGGNNDIGRVTEKRLSQAVEDMLSRTLGLGHVRAEASVEIDFDRVNETQELFDPDGQVTHNQQTVTDGNKNIEQQASVSVQNNLPNPEAQNSGGTGSTTSHQEENTTFDNSKTVRTRIRDTPSIKKVSMAVLVDGVTTFARDGKPAWRELNQIELDRIATLVKSAVGYDEKRGDRVEVVNMHFSMPDELGDTEPTGFAGMRFGKDDLVWLVTLGVITLVALFALGFVVRPIALRLTTLRSSPLLTLAAEKARGGGAAAQLSAPDVMPANAQIPGLPAPDAIDEDTMLNIANVQGEVRASSIRQLSKLVEVHPDATATVLRGWLAHKAT